MYKLARKVQNWHAGSNVIKRFNDDSYRVDVWHNATVGLIKSTCFLCAHMIILEVCGYR